MEVLTKTEELVSEAVGTKTVRRSLTTAARVLIVLAFTDDIYSQQYGWWSNVNYFAQTWGVSKALVGPILGLLVTAEFFGTLLILTQQRFELGCGALFCGTVFQLIFFRHYRSTSGAMRDLSLCGCVTMVMLERWTDPGTMEPGPPSLKWDGKLRTVMQFTGRVLVGLMFLRLADDLGSRNVLLLFGYLLLSGVILGYKTRVCAGLLSALFFLTNLTVCSWWMEEPDSPKREFLRAEFFLNFAAIGGLLLETVVGPGKASLDAQSGRRVSRSQ
ncbi:PREDICTED: surfeit locus protein 4 homolog [Branchiostoma belcheri]|uniref:Surfeit locus protein 4 homolog n=1 Tax=Branchiostoma belcheri TaxID=7741 RepID=A0A6P4YAS8_BRABE|nr:PREDICTED: surfeit locus protein 4 homolog [Branchiostoma belcheri]